MAPDHTSPDQTKNNQTKNNETENEQTQDDSSREDRHWLAMQRQAHREFAMRLDAITDWEAPTPDTEWNVRDLVTHVIDEQQWIPHLLAGTSVATARTAIAPIGSDLRAEWRLYSLAATLAWDAAALDAPVSLSYDTVPAREYLREQVSDVTIHAWDLARAVGVDESLDENLVSAVWTVFEPQRATLSASGLFADPVQLDANASLQSQLLAITGRRM